MKKLLYVIIALITLSSCKKDEKENVNPLLDAKWELVSAKYKYNDQTDDHFYTYYTTEGNPDKRYIEFKTDNSATEYFKYGDSPIYYRFRSTYVLNGNAITSEVYNWGNTITYSVDGDTLIITIINEYYTEVLTYKKSIVDLSNATQQDPV